MINVTIYKSEKHECMRFRAYGHAGYSIEGQDIVCAAASMFMINTINAIEKFTKDEFTCLSDDEEGMIDFELKREPSHDTKVLLKTMILGLRSIYEDYEEFINITFEEV